MSLAIPFLSSLVSRGFFFLDCAISVHMSERSDMIVLKIVRKGPVFCDVGRMSACPAMKRNWNAMR